MDGDMSYNRFHNWCALQRITHVPLDSKLHTVID